MAASKLYKGQALLFGSTDVPFVDGSLQVGNNLNAEEITSGNTLTPDLRTIVGKRPYIRATLLDPSQLTAVQPVGALETITAVKAVFRAYDQNGGPGSTYKSFAGAQGIVMPVSLTFAAQQRATLEALFMAAFSSGTGLSVGTDNDAAATVAKAFYPTSLVLGGSDTILNIQSGSVNWEYGVEDENVLEPGYYVTTRAVRTGQIVTQNLAWVTAARLEDGVVESAVLTLTDRESGGGTVAVNLGDCLIRAEISNNQATITFEEVTG